MLDITILQKLSLPSKTSRVFLGKLHTKQPYTVERRQIGDLTNCLTDTLQHKTNASAEWLCFPNLGK